MTDAVPETIEASLQLSEAALVGLGVPTGPVIASIHEKARRVPSELQEAGGPGRTSDTRSIRAKHCAPHSWEIGVPCNLIAGLHPLLIVPAFSRPALL